MKEKEQKLFDLVRTIAESRPVDFQVIKMAAMKLVQEISGNDEKVNPVFSDRPHYVEVEV